MNTEGARWCRSCGDEYRPEIDDCAACQIPLVDERPTVLVPVAVDDVSIEPVDEPLVVDLASLTAAQRAALAEHVDVVPIPLRIVGEGLIQAEDGYEEELELALERVLGSAEPRYRRPDTEIVGDPIGRTRRAIAAALDASIAFAVAGSVFWFTADASLTALALLATLAANHIGGLGARGVSVGKRLVGATVRTVAGESLQAVDAAVRWGSRDGPALLSVGLWVALDDPSWIVVALQLAGLLHAAAVLASIVLSPQCRGIHDDVIDSVVVEAEQSTLA